MSTSESVGLGYCSEKIENCSEESLWTAMLSKIENVSDFLPVLDVVCEKRERGECVWRTMKFNGPGPLNGKVIVEHIYADASAGEIRFVNLDADGKETDTEVVNVMLRDPLKIEYYQRSVASKERLAWMAPKAGAII